MALDKSCFFIKRACLAKPTAFSMSKKWVINANNSNSFFPKRTFWAIRREFGRKYIKRILKIGKFYFRLTTSQILFARAKYVSKNIIKLVPNLVYLLLQMKFRSMHLCTCFSPNRPRSSFLEQISVLQG